MSEYVIQGQTLTDIADAIRSKSGTQQQYHPDQMAAAIEAIPAGGTEMEDLLVTRPSTFTEYTNNRVTEIGGYLFYANSNIQNVTFGSVTYIKSAAFWTCNKLKKVVMPMLERTESNIFRQCDELEMLDFPRLLSLNGNGHFLGSPKFSTLILRANSVCTLGSTNSFQGTPVESGTGYIYVPDDLVDQYKVATNWVTYAGQIKALSELPQEV